MFPSVEIAGMVCPNNVFLAPLAGYTNYPFRELCRGLGAGLTFTEMVSCKGLAYGSEETKKLLYCGSESPKAAQIFGNAPDIMRAACESEALAPFDLIDINMGCPMPKIVRNGEGNALMENLPLAEKVIAACVKSGKRISVKFRTGVTEEKKTAAEFARLCEGAGACMITVHGRTREKIYAGAPDYAEIAAAKNAVRKRRNLVEKGCGKSDCPHGRGRGNDRARGALSPAGVFGVYGNRAASLAGAVFEAVKRNAGTVRRTVRVRVYAQNGGVLY